MKYCCTVDQKHGTCYQEFLKGKYEGKHWNKDSLLLDDDLVDDLGLYDLWIEIIPSHNRWGPTEIDYATWQRIWLAANQIGGEALIAMSEVNQWAEKNFKTETVFTILGV